MASDYILAARRAILKAMKANGQLTGFVPKAQIYPATVPPSPPWPFTRIGSIIATPFRASGLHGSAFRIMIQGFAKDRTNAAGTVLSPAEEQAMILGAAIMASLDDVTLDVPDGKLRLTWVQNIASIDGDEAGAWMVSCVFRGEVCA
jgi:hypothetical protein